MKQDLFHAFRDASGRQAPPGPHVRNPPTRNLLFREINLQKQTARTFSHFSALKVLRQVHRCSRATYPTHQARVRIAFGAVPCDHGSFSPELEAGQM
jgi:hypothetical protein